LTAEDFPQTGRLAAVDYGTVRLGVSICDPDRILASPLEVYPSRGRKLDAEYFRELAKQERLTGFVVGLPIHCDGGESEKSREARRFARWLRETTELPVRLFDERFSTAQAKQRMSGRRMSHQKRKRQLDAVAALVLLESFLESCRYHGQVVGQSVDQAALGDDALE
jgi:putative Holliday junction resolvase